MKCFVHFFDVFAVDMSIDFGSRYERMSEQFLNDSQIGASLEKVCRE